MDKKKRLALVLPSLHGGGCERAVSLILPALKEDYQVSLVLHSAEVNYEIPEGIEIVKFSGDTSAEHNFFYKLFRLFSRVKSLKRLFRDKQFDLILSFIDMNNVATYFAHKSACPSIPLICVEQTICEEFFEHNPYAKRKFWIMKKLLTYVYKRVDMLIVLSDAMASYLKKTFSINRNIEVIYNGIDETIFKILTEKDRLAEEKSLDFQFQNAKIRLVNVGRIERYQKNQEFLIKIFPEILEIIPEAELFIIGEGEDRNYLETIIAEKELTQNVHFLGWQKDLAPYLRSADLLLLSSRYETFGNVLIESIACGTPVVTTRSNAVIDEILAGGEYGFIVPVDDSAEFIKAIKKAFALKDNDEYKLRISEYARDGFNLKCIQNQYLTAIRKVI